MERSKLVIKEKNQEMKYLQLFESFDSPVFRVQSWLEELKGDSSIGHYNLVIESDPDSLMHMIIWTNPAEDEAWRDSGYGEDYDGDFSSVSPMPVLGFFSIFGNDITAYMLSPEEKYYGKIVLSSNDDIGELDEDQMVEIKSAKRLKKAIIDSIWQEW